MKTTKTEQENRGSNWICIVFSNSPGKPFVAAAIRSDVNRRELLMRKHIFHPLVLHELDIGDGFAWSAGRPVHPFPFHLSGRDEAALLALCRSVRPQPRSFRCVGRSVLLLLLHTI